MASDQADPQLAASLGRIKDLSHLEQLLVEAGRRLASGAALLNDAVEKGIDIDRARLPITLTRLCCEMFLSLVQEAYGQRVDAVRKALLDAASNRLYLSLFGQEDEERPGALEYFRMIFLAEADDFEDSELKAISLKGASLLTASKDLPDQAGREALTDFFSEVVDQILSSAEQAADMEAGILIDKEVLKEQVSVFLKDSKILETAKLLF